MFLFAKWVLADTMQLPLIFFFHTIDNLSLPAGTLRTFTFNVITETTELKYATLLAVFHLFHLGVYFLPRFVLNVLNSTLSPPDIIYTSLEISSNDCSKVHNIYL